MILWSSSQADELEDLFLKSSDMTRQGTRTQVYQLSIAKWTFLPCQSIS